MRKVSNLASFEMWVPAIFMFPAQGVAIRILVLPHVQ
jgi:hypothetical protein